LNVISTVLAIAMVEREWVPYRVVFRRRWASVGMIGSYVGEAGLPNILKASVMLSMICHFLGLFLDGPLRTIAEASNLLFLELTTKDPNGLHFVRSGLHFVSRSR